ncbi:MAG: cation transporter [Granulosicoccaceae bacterium]|jgi:copper chaperone CopZ
MAEVTLKIEGMKCSGCVASVKQALEVIEGVDSVEVSLEQHMAKISGNADPGILAEAVTSAGYPAEVA